jgi:hypothetical protein
MEAVGVAMLVLILSGVVMLALWPHEPWKGRSAFLSMYLARECINFAVLVAPARDWQRLQALKPAATATSAPAKKRMFSAFGGRELQDGRQ